MPLRRGGASWWVREDEDRRSAEALGEFDGPPPDAIIAAVGQYRTTLEHLSAETASPFRANRQDTRRQHSAEIRRSATCVGYRRTAAISW
jgi:hypothetical protein